MRAIRTALIWLIASAGIAHAAPAASREAASNAAFQVSHCLIGPDADQELRKYASYFITRLDARAEFDAAALAAGRVPGAWREPPPGVAPERWISVVTACIGARRDWLAFAFDAAGDVRFAVRRPALNRNTAGIYPFSIPPGPEQIDRNAAIELAADFALGHASAVATSAPALHLTVEQSAVAAAAGDELTLGVSKKEDDSGSQALPMSTGELDAFTAIATAAACEAGWRVTAGAAPASLTLRVTRRVLSYSVTADLQEEGRKRAIEKPGVKIDAVHDYLLTLLKQLRHGDAAAYDFAQLGMYPSIPLACVEQVLVVAQQHSLRAFDMRTGEQRWELLPQPPTRETPRYTARTGTDGVSRVYCWDPSLAQVSLVDGALTVAPGNLPKPACDWAFDGALPGPFVVSDGRTLTFAPAKGSNWQFEAETEITCGPLLTPSLVLAGTRAGRLHARAIPDGHALWTCPIEGRPVGPIAADPATAYVTTLEGALCAVALADGRAIWHQELGDTTLRVVPRPGGVVLAAVNDNTVRMLDAATGAEKSRWSATDWIGGADALRKLPVVAVAQRDGPVAWLAADTLKARSTLDLRTRLVPAVLAIDAAPWRWGANDDFVPSGACAIVADDRGFIYIVPAEAGK